MSGMELSEVESVLDRFVAEVTELLQPPAIWAHGSLALGDYQPGRSDLDLVAVLANPLSQEQTTQLTALHTRLLGEAPAAEKLQCAYLPISEIADTEMRHYNFAFARASRSDKASGLIRVLDELWRSTSRRSGSAVRSNVSPGVSA